MNISNNPAVSTRSLRLLFGAAFWVVASLHCVAHAEPGETGRTLTLFHDEEYELALKNIEAGGVDSTPAILYYQGYCHEYALGGASKDIEKAKDFYRKAAKGGDDKAAKRLAEIADKERTHEEIEALKKRQEEMEKAKKHEEDEFNKKLKEWQAIRDKEIGVHEKEIAALREKLDEARKKGDSAVAEKIRKTLSDADARHKLALQDMEGKLDEMRRGLADMEDKYNVRFDDLHKAISKLRDEPVITPIEPNPRRPDNQSSPLGFAMFAPAQFPPVDSDVTGFRLSIFYGRNHDVFGLDVGALVSIADGDLMGLEVSGFFNQVGSSSGALQIGGIANVCNGDFLGLQIGGIANSVKGEFSGVQIGTINLSPGDMNGMQIGVFNSASKASGLQIGVVNHAEQMKGVQIGLINQIDNSPYPCLPVFNANF